MNRNYLDHIRSNSFYPAFRGFIQFFTLVGYIAAGLVALFGFFTKSIGAILLFLLGTAVLAVLVRVAKEVSLMLADIADATINFAGSQPDAFKTLPSFGDKIPRPADQQRA
ncbi:hypothetical protein [Novilysobacter arseniciresistens]|uniref:hypothetical protein n=1 Tax=Novilysobacter arseniciresistens TaxID=1385522 RepID=UPI001269AFA4|nr:hypothetical protein [Lysobacter arseniciresistens]